MALTIFLSWAFVSDKNIYNKYLKLNLSCQNDFPAKLKLFHALMLSSEYYENKIRSLRDEGIIQKFIKDSEIRNLKMLVYVINENINNNENFRSKFSILLDKLEDFDSPFKNYDEFKKIMKDIKEEFFGKDLKIEFMDVKVKKINYYLIVIAFITAILNLAYFFFTSVQ